MKAAWILAIGLCTAAILVLATRDGNGKGSVERHSLDTLSNLTVSPPYTSFDMIADFAEGDAVVEGTVVTITAMVSYTTTPTPASTEDYRADLIPDAIQHTQYEVKITAIYLDDGQIGEVNDTFTYEQGGYPLAETAETAEFPLLNIGDSALMVIGRFPDDVYVQTLPPWSVFNMSGSQVTYYNAEQTPVHFATSLTPAQFRTQLAAALD